MTNTKTNKQSTIIFMLQNYVYCDPQAREKIFFAICTTYYVSLHKEIEVLPHFLLPVRDLRLPASCITVTYPFH